MAGQVLWQNKPGADEEVSLIVHRHDHGYPGKIASYGSVRTDQAGKFTFDRMLPGLVQISRPIKTSDPDSANTPRWRLSPAQPSSHLPRGPSDLKRLRSM